jgi:hypothetical protein
MDESSKPLDFTGPSLMRIDRPAPGRLAHLHRCTIAVRFQAFGQDRLLRGEGVWKEDSQLGAVLQIHFPEHPDDGEFLVVEREWTGLVESGEPAGCDFLIRF